MHIGIFLHPYTLENKFEGAFDDFVGLHCPIPPTMYGSCHIETDQLCICHMRDLRWVR